ncbi:unnamed protein product [Prunus brigantina]
MKKLVRECEHRLKSAASRQVSLPNIGSLLCSFVSNVEQKKRKGMNGPLDRAFQNEAIEQCDVEVARMFYTGGLSFRLARNSHYRNSYLRASTLPGYVPPGYNALRTTLLQQKNRHIEGCLQPIKSTWSTKGVSVCSDGRFKEVTEGLEQMVISPNWSLYKEDDVGKARAVKEKILDEYFWDEIDYILSFTASIYEMIRMADTDKPSLHLVYEWWDTIIEKVKTAIYRKEHKQLHEQSNFFDVVYHIIVERWTKSSTPFHCLAHSLNLKLYSPKWLQEDPSHVAPCQDAEITRERKKCLNKYFLDDRARRDINV